MKTRTAKKWHGTAVKVALPSIFGKYDLERSKCVYFLRFLINKSFDKSNAVSVRRIYWVIGLAK